MKRQSKWDRVFAAIETDPESKKRHYTEVRDRAIAVMAIYGLPNHCYIQASRDLESVRVAFGIK